MYLVEIDQRDYLSLGVPFTLNLRVELGEELSTALSPRLAQRRLIKKEVDTKVFLANNGFICDSEPSNTCKKDMAPGQSPGIVAVGTSELTNQAGRGS